MTIQAKRLQSALEFMTTYGWVILIIVIVLATLYATGVFNIASSTPNVCNLSTGIGCATVSFTPTGTLTVSLQQSTQDTINVVSLGCNDQGIAADMVPALPPASISVGGNSTFSVECYKTVSGSLIPFTGQPGQAFKGYLIVNYTDLATGFTQTTTGAITQGVTTPQPQSPLGFGALEYIPITITNTNTVAATGANFQQLITIPASTYTSYEAADLGNVRFSLGSSELNSWCESGCSSGAGSAVFWVALPNGIAANSNVVVQLMFFSTPTEYDGVYAGEAPQLSASYGQYDNGALVFPLYQNFTGGSYPRCAGGWTCSVPFYKGLAMTAGSGTSKLDTNNSYFSYSPVIEDTYANLGVTNNALSNVAAMSFTEQAYNSVKYTFYLGYQNNVVGLAGVSFPTQPPLGFHVWTFAPGGIVSASYDYNSNTAVYYQISLNPLTQTLLGYNTTNNASITAYWTRLRINPPNGVMPSVAFGNVI